MFLRLPGPFSNLLRPFPPPLYKPSSLEMDQRVEELSRRPPYVYDLPQDILFSLERDVDGKEDANSQSHIEIEPRRAAENGCGTESGAGGSISCFLCTLTFSNVEEQRSHIRSDLHGYNLKQKLNGLPPVSENEFERLVGDLNDSLSGYDSSDSEDVEEETQRQSVLSALLKKQAAIIGQNAGNLSPVTPRETKHGPGSSSLIWFTTPILPPEIRLGIYRALFTTSESGTEKDVIRRMQLSSSLVSKASQNGDRSNPQPQLFSDPHVFLCMIGGGHFAAMVISLTPKQTGSSPAGSLAREAIVLAHKTFHRYTTRRKQGGSQSANDSAKGAAHSAGSSLRRYNESALTDEVRLLLSDWKGMIDSSELLFVRATGNTNKRTLFGPYDGQILHKEDPRLRGFPFSTRRATQNELMRSFLELTRLKVQKADEIPSDTDTPAVEDRKPTKKSSSDATQRSEEQEIALLHTAQIQALIRRSKLPALLSYIRSNHLSSDFRFHAEDAQQQHHASTPLHLAASQNSPVLVSGLLIKGGADPTLRNGDGRPAFDLAGDRATRDAFRIARSSLGEPKWNWDTAHVPAALSKSEADERDERERHEIAQQEAERRKAEEERLQLESPRVGGSGILGKAAGRGRALALGHVQKTAREKREEESRGLTPEMRSKLERERRARAAEERIRTLENDV